MDESVARVATGIEGLDEVMSGGFVPARAYLVRGGPGCGKTTFGLHFLTGGVKQGERVLFISLGEPEALIRENARSLDFDLTGVNFLDLSPSPEFFTEVESYDIFSPAEVEREPTTRKIVETVEELNPTRVFIDAMTQFRYLSADAFQFRKQALSFLRYLTSRGVTVVITSEGSQEAPDDDLQFLCDGVVNLESGSKGKTLSINKFRGSNFRSGEHSMVLSDSGIRLFPKLVPGAYRRKFSPEIISSGIPDLDELLHGGIERGTTTLITGPSGVGKSTLGLQFMKEAAGRGERSVVYVFEEAVEILTRRCESINIPVQTMVKNETLSMVKVIPLELTPDEFAFMVRKEVEEKQARIVMIDSVAGYRLAMKGEDLVEHLYALTKYLVVNMGVTVLIINEVESITGEFKATDVGISYLADNIVFLHYLELMGEIHKSIGVLKKRLSDFEKTLREYQITRYGIKVGKPLTNLRGILTGTPELLQTPEVGK